MPSKSIMLSNFFYQYFNSEQSEKLRDELKQTKFKKPDAYKSLNASSAQIYPKK
jgi:hypothetical protein